MGCGEVEFLMGVSVCALNLIHIYRVLSSASPLIFVFVVFSSSLFFSIVLSLLSPSFTFGMFRIRVHAVDLGVDIDYFFLASSMMALRAVRPGTLPVRAVVDIPRHLPSTRSRCKNELSELARHACIYAVGVHLERVCSYRCTLLSWSCPHLLWILSMDTAAPAPTIDIAVRLGGRAGHGREMSATPGRLDECAGVRQRVSHHSLRGGIRNEKYRFFFFGIYSLLACGRFSCHGAP